MTTKIGNAEVYWNGEETLNKWKIDVKKDRNIWLDNDGTSPYVMYQQLSDQGNGWRQGMAERRRCCVPCDHHRERCEIDGAYSYAGSDTALEGKNYPFPTVLTAFDTLGRQSVYITADGSSGRFVLVTPIESDLPEA